MFVVIHDIFCFSAEFEGTAVLILPCNVNSCGIHFGDPKTYTYRWATVYKIALISFNDRMCQFYRRNADTYYVNFTIEMLYLLLQFSDWVENFRNVGLIMRSNFKN